ncbi:MAG: enoyl-CoA hydratase/isomerase family protein [Chloroflexi bacterium]|nr:enoyl-CoA hydratase/isomerase family protein [Chloroflexota bacterium]
MAAFELEVVDGHIAVMHLNRSDAMNAINREMREGMEAAFERLNSDRELHVAILIGEGGRAFSAGADLKEIAEAGGFGGTPWTPRVSSLMGTLEVWKPLIAAIDGFCLGADSRCHSRATSASRLRRRRLGCRRSRAASFRARAARSASRGRSRSASRWSC